MSKLSRRSVVAGAATIPAAAVLPIAAQAAAEPDPIFALIERYKEAAEIYSKAVVATDQASEHFQDKFGGLVPDAFSKKFRSELEKQVPETNLHKCRTSTREQIEMCRGVFEDDEFVEILHEELRRQTKAYDETVKPLELAQDDAADRWSDAFSELIETPPATVNSLAAVLAFVLTDKQAMSFLGSIEPDYFVKALADHTAKLARAQS